MLSGSSSNNNSADALPKRREFAARSRYFTDTARRMYVLPSSRQASAKERAWPGVTNNTVDAARLEGTAMMYVWDTRRRRASPEFATPLPYARTAERLVLREQPTGNVYSARVAVGMPGTRRLRRGYVILEDVRIDSLGTSPETGLMRMPDDASERDVNA